MKQTVLIVEDEYAIRNLLENLLTENGYVVVGCDSAESALKRVHTFKPDLILLDIQLAKMNGLEFCRKIRSESRIKDVPIIFLSVHSSDAYKITALESGGDDFLTKPFSQGELLARVKAVLRRSGRSRTRAPHVLKDELFMLNLDSHTANLEENDLPLTPKEFSLLAAFLKARGRILSRDSLSAQVWERENLTTSRTIDVHISRLRKKLGKAGAAIKTLGKIGYKYEP